MLWRSLLRSAGLITGVWASLGAAQADPLGISNAFHATPTGFEGSVNDLSFGLAVSDETRDLFVDFQPIDGLRVGIGFPTFIDGDDAQTGNALSVAWRIVDEGDLRPQIVAGLTRLGSDARQSGEYLLAAKSIGAFDATVGLGWGRFAAVTTGRGDDEGVLLLDHLFAEDPAPFGSVVWQPQDSGFAIGAEYGTQRRGATDLFEGATLGVSYTTENGLTYGAFASEDGTAALRFGMVLNPYRPFTLEDATNAPLHLSSRPAPANIAPDALVTFINERLADNQIYPRSITISADMITVAVAQNGDENFAQKTGRIVRVLAAITPRAVTKFRVIQHQGGFDTNAITINRRVLGRAIDQPDGAARVLAATTIENATGTAGQVIYQDRFRPASDLRFGPQFRVDFLRAEELTLVGDIKATGTYAMSENTRLRAQLGYRFLNQWTQTDPPPAPRVRSDFTAYAPDTITLDAATVTYLRKLGDSIYGRVSAGYFERMYGGLSVEAVWRDARNDYALGLEATYAVKRAYDTPLGFEDLTAHTLLATLYANIGAQGDFVELEAGRYLAEDFGIGLTIGRDFTNGWRVAARTSWSEDDTDPLQFGVLVEIPMGWAVPTPSARKTRVSIGAGFGDTAARVNGTGRLTNTLFASDPQRLRDEWGSFWN